MKSWIDQIKLDDKGLIPAIIQDARTKEVLMVAYMNPDSLRMTIKTGQTHFFSRSRNKMWLKGESSGHIQKVKKIAFDCDADALLISVTQVGGACHTGYKTCFYRASTDGKAFKTVGKRLFDPDKVYGKA